MVQTATTDTEQLQVREVYVSDIIHLKYMYNEWKGVPGNTPVDEAFGIPFLQLKCGEKLLAFASFVVDEGSKYVLYQDSCSIGKTKENSLILEEIARYIPSGFQDKEQLERGIRRLIHWLNNAKG